MLATAGTSDAQLPPYFGTWSLLTERRRHAPPGADGGEDGERGRNVVAGAEVGPKATGTLRAGERLRLETPGGGGHGAR